MVKISWIAMSLMLLTMTENCHAELVSASQTHPSLVLDLLVTSLAIYEYASACTLCSLVLHAHRVSHMLPCNSVLNLLAIRTRFASFVRKSAPLKREGTIPHAEFISASQINEILRLSPQSFLNNPSSNSYQ